MTRRYYRSGESEYAINGTAVRLRDVNELFMDTGWAKRGMPSLGREKLMRFSRPKAPSGGKSSRRRRGSPIAATKRRRPSANWSAPRRTCCGLGTNWRNWSSSAPPCRPRRNRPRPTWALREELRVLEISLWMDQLDQQRAKGAALEKDLATARQELESCSVQADQLYAKGETLCSSCGTSRPRRKHCGPSSRTTKPSSGTTASGWNFSGTG